MKAILLSCLLLFSCVTFAPDIFQSEHEMISEKDTASYTGANNISEEFETWKYRQLPNVTTVGQTQPIQVMDAVVKEGDGIYFLIAQYRGPGRYSGDWYVNFGSVQINVRDYIGSCDTCSFGALAKLNFDGEWEWAKYVSNNPRRMDYIIEWSDDAVALIGDNYAFNDGIVNQTWWSAGHDDILVFAKDGTIIHRDENSMESANGNYYIGTYNSKHYFSGEWVERQDHPGHTLPFGLELCLEDNQNLFYFYSLNSNFQSELIFSTTRGGPTQIDIQFNQEEFIFSIPYRGGTPDVIHYDSTCNEKYDLEFNSSSPDYDFSAQGNPSNSPPVFLGTYQPVLDLIEPRALMSFGCYLLDYRIVENLDDFMPNYCHFNGGWVAYNLRYAELDYNWDITGELIVLIDVPTDDNTYHSSGGVWDMAVDLDNLNSEELILYNQAQIQRISKTEYNSQPFGTYTTFYHSVHGVSFSSNDAYTGLNMENSNPQLVSSIPFEPFTELPYRTDYVQAIAWNFLPTNITYSLSHPEGIYFTTNYNTWGNTPENMLLSDSYFFSEKPSRSSFTSSNGSLILVDTLIPYIYDPVTGIQGLPTPEQGNYVFFFARGEVANILAPFSNFIQYEGGSGNDNNTEQGEGEICVVEDFDCDGLLDDDSDEDDMDADGILDIVELSEGIGDVGITNTEYLHELEISNTDSGIKIVLEFRVNEAYGYGTYVSQIMMFDENGNDTSTSSWQENFNNSQMVRLEDALCTNPQGILGPSFNPVLWLNNNITINGVATDASNTECEWIDKPSTVNGMDYPESYLDPSHTYLYDKKMRYTFEYNTASTGVLSVNIPNLRIEQ